MPFDTQIIPFNIIKGLSVANGNPDSDKAARREIVKNLLCFVHFATFTRRAVWMANRTETHGNPRKPAETPAETPRKPHGNLAETPREPCGNPAETPHEPLRQPCASPAETPRRPRSKNLEQLLRNLLLGSSLGLFAEQSLGPDRGSFSCVMRLVTPQETMYGNHALWSCAT